VKAVSSVCSLTYSVVIRLALGAEKGQVFRMVLRQGLRLAIAGLALGLILSVILSRFLKIFLFGVTPSDLLTFAIVAVLLASVALLACLLPARSATQVDPMVALRCE
jgi:putative ABC transport system permease protein